MSVEQMQFQTEVSQLLHIVIHSLYSNKEIFLRELISNASDAIDKARYESITNPDINEGDTEWYIKLIPDSDNKTLTIRDNGIGMNKEDLIKSLGTIAHSGTKEFLQKVVDSGRASDINTLIGQFGVGFYSSFMVADKVTVITRKRGEKQAYEWQSDAQSSYTIKETDKQTPGTDIILHFKDDELSLLGEWPLRRIVSTYSDYIEYPVVMDVEKPVYDDEGKPTDKKEIVKEVLNSQKALWLKDKSEVTEDELNQFYKHLSKDFTDPIKSIQIKAEGTSEFYALLFIPSHAPFDLFQRETKFGPMLYVKRVQIMENCEELLPQYLRFIHGVVDSSDLPLNISREILQNNRQIEIIKKNLVKRVLDTLSDMQKSENDKYKTFFAELGKVLKEGIHYDYERRETIASLCLFESTATKIGDSITLDDYISRMKSTQEEIYYITGNTRGDLENSPYIESLSSKGFEVLFMTDEIDDIVFSGLGEYKGKRFKSVLKGDLATDDPVSDSTKESFKILLTKIKEVLGDKVEEVRLTNRLQESAVCLVTGEGAPDANMERILRAMGQPVPSVKRYLEINPEHELIKVLNGKADSDPDVISKYSLLLYDQAVLSEGGKVENISDFVKSITSLMLKDLK